MNHQIHPRIIRQLFVLLIILLLGILIFLKLLPYFSGVLGAITLYVLLKGFMRRMTRRGWNENLSVSVLLIGSFILILLPLFGIVYMLSSKISLAISNSERLLRAIKGQFQGLEETFDYNISSQIDTSAITSWLSSNLQNLAVGTFDVTIAISIMYFLLYFMLTNQTKFKESLEIYIPIGKSNLRIIGAEAIQKVKANAIGIPMVAIIQGVVALIGYLIFDVPDPFFWFVVTAVGSVIPFVGTALGILPVTIILFSQGLNFQAIGILLYGSVVVGSSDNLIRLYVLKKMADEHPLITLLGVIIGIPLFGFIGLIFGPLMISLFILMVKLYKKEYADEDGSNYEISSLAEEEEDNKEIEEETKTAEKKKEEDIDSSADEKQKAED